MPDSHEETITCEIVIKWYKVSSRSQFGEETLSGLGLQALMDVLGNPDWNQVYHCWKIHSRHMPRLQPFVNHKFDKAKFVYFIEAYKNQLNA